MDIYVFRDLNGKRNTGTFYEKYLQKANPEESRAEKVIKKNGDKLYVKYKGYIKNNLILGLIKKMLNKNESIFSKPYKLFGEDIHLKWVYLIMQQKHLKNATGVYTSKLAAKTDLVNLKAEVYKLDIDEVESVATNLSYLKNKVH